MNSRDGSARRLEVDWLRTLVVFMLFPFHAARVFDGRGYYVEAAAPSAAADFFVRFALVWAMPLLFALAGFASHYSLRKRGSRVFVRERFLRLGVPFVFGVAVLGPLQGFVGFRCSGGRGSFIEYLPHF